MIQLNREILFFPPIFPPMPHRLLDIFLICQRPIYKLYKYTRLTFQWVFENLASNPNFGVENPKIFSSNLYIISELQHLGSILLASWAREKKFFECCDDV